MIVLWLLIDQKFQMLSSENQVVTSLNEERLSERFLSENQMNILLDIYIIRLQFSASMSPSFIIACISRPMCIAEK